MFFMKTEKEDFKMYNNLAYDAYMENNVGVESSSKLVEMLYEGVLKFNAQAKRAIKDENVDKKVYWINRSVAIITELMMTLDMKSGDIAYYLDGLYNYQARLLTEANIENNIEKLDEVSSVFKVLLEAWREETHVG